MKWQAKLSYRTDPLRKATSPTQAEKGDVVQVETDTKMYGPEQLSKFPLHPVLYISVRNLLGLQVVQTKKKKKKESLFLTQFSLPFLNTSSLSLFLSILSFSNPVLEF